MLNDKDVKRRQNEFIAGLRKNQVINLTIIRFDAAGTTKEKTWEVILETETEASPWLTHFGLTYAPPIISKTKSYYSKADPVEASKYAITEKHNNDHDAWDNISVTVNFTYPFSSKPKHFDAGFTAGFGLNPDLQLSGHAGLSAIIGTNVIISSGVVLMQKYRLKGEFESGQVIKENLSYDALHEKVWRPEVFFTIGFRFAKNPFGGSDAKKEDGDKPAND